MFSAFVATLKRTPTALLFTCAVLTPSRRLHPLITSRKFHHAQFASPLLYSRAFVSTRTKTGTPVPCSDLERLPATREVLQWVRDCPRKGERSVEVIKRKEDGDDGEWIVEVYLQDTGAELETDLFEGDVKGKGKSENIDDATTEAAEEALDVLVRSETEHF